MKALWNKTKNWLNTNNHLLWVSIIALIMIGLVATYFIGPYELARHDWGQHFGSHYFFNKFWPFALVGTIILFACSKLSKKWVLRLSWILGVCAFLLMLQTIISPIIIHGAARYAHFGPAFIDPFVLMLPAYIVLMSHWLSKDKMNKTWTTIGTTALTLFIIWTAANAPYIFMAQAYLLLFFILGFKARKNIPGPFYVGIGMLIAFVALMVLAIEHWPHVQIRVLQLFESSPLYSQSWWATQALTHSTLIGNTPDSLAALKTLPGSITDYTVTSMIAKFGYLVGLLILALYGCVAKGLTNTIQNTKDKFGKMLSTGALGMFAIYTIVALLVAFGILATAADWPFLGYAGGTLFLTWCILFGFVIAVNKK